VTENTPENTIEAAADKRAVVILPTCLRAAIELLLKDWPKSRKMRSAPGAE